MHLDLPSADSTPRGFDFDLAFAAFWLGDALESQVFAAVEADGVHEFF